MVIEHHVQGYENFLKEMEKFKKDEIVHVYFTGSENGNVWCPDCVRAWPVIKKGMEKADKNSHFVYVEIGDRKYFDSKCPFRKHPKVQLKQVPTVQRWMQPQRLEGLQCEKLELMEMFFTDEME